MILFTVPQFCWMPRVLFKKMKLVFFTHFLHTTWKSVSHYYIAVRNIFHTAFPYCSVCLVFPVQMPLHTLAHPSWIYFLCLLLLSFEMACKANLQYSRWGHTIILCMVILTITVRLGCGFWCKVSVLFLQYKTHSSDESEEFLVECEDVCKSKSSRDNTTTFSHENHWEVGMSHYSFCGF